MRVEDGSSVPIGHGSMIDKYMADRQGEIGPWLAGGMIDFFLAGIMVIRISNHCCQLQKECLRVKVIMFFLVLLNTLKSAQALGIMWTKFVSQFGDTRAITHTSWLQYTEPLMTVLICHYVQAYYMRRILHVFRRSYLIIAPTILFVALSFSAAIAWVVRMSNASHNESLSQFQKLNLKNSLLRAGLCGSATIITAALIYHVSGEYRGRPRRDYRLILRSLPSLCWQTTFPAWVVLSLNLVFYLAMGEENFVFVVWNMASSKLYSISLLYVIASDEEYAIEQSVSLQSTSLNWVKSGTDLLSRTKSQVGRKSFAFRAERFGGDGNREEPLEIVEDTVVHTRITREKHPRWHRDRRARLPKSDEFDIPDQRIQTTITAALSNSRPGTGNRETIATHTTEVDKEVEYVNENDGERSGHAGSSTSGR